jgi:ankyrin repeat protein
LDKKDELNGSPIIYAVKRGHHDCVSMLLESGANLQGEADLVLLALTRGNVPLIKLLRDAGLDVEHRPDSLHYAAHFAHVELLKYLLDLGVDPAAAMEDGGTALDTARARLVRFPDHKGLPLVIGILEKA